MELWSKTGLVGLNRLWNVHRENVLNAYRNENFKRKMMNAVENFISVYTGRWKALFSRRENVLVQ